MFGLMLGSGSIKPNLSVNLLKNFTNPSLLVSAIITQPVKAWKIPQKEPIFICIGKYAKKNLPFGNGIKGHGFAGKKICCKMQSKTHHSDFYDCVVYQKYNKHRCRKAQLSP
jgi:hypothetical protein